MWPSRSILFSLWYVRKAWNENAVNKIGDPLLRVEILKAAANIMYSSDLNQGLVVVRVAEDKTKDLVRSYPAPKDFVDFKKKIWMSKTSIWVIGNCNF